MGELDTRVALAEQRITQVENWIKDLSTKINSIEEGVNNHLTETAKEMGTMRKEFTEQLSDVKSANAKYALTILASIIVSLAVMVLK